VTKNRTENKTKTKKQKNDNNKKQDKELAIVPLSASCPPQRLPMESSTKEDSAEDSVNDIKFTILSKVLSTDGL